MPSTLPLMPTAVANAERELPIWWVTAPDDTYVNATSITALTYKIENLDTGAVVQATIDGWGAGAGTNGVVIAANGGIKHTVSAAQNAPTGSGSERRRVTYTVTHTSGK